MREAIQEGVERILADLVTPKVLERAWHGEWNEELWGVLFDNGFTVAACSAEAGGSGASWDDLYPLFVACGYFQLPLPLPDTILANRILEDAGIPHPGGLVGIAAPRCSTPSRSGECGIAGYVPWGRKCEYVLVASEYSRDHVLLFDSKDLTLEQGTNLAREPRDLVLLGEAGPIATGRLQNAQRTIMHHGAMLRAAQAAGAAQSAVKNTIQYAGERVQFGRPLAKLQTVQQQIASAVSEVAALNAASEYACSVGESDRAWASAIAKVTASEAAAVVCDVAHAVHGAIGYTFEYKLHHATQRLRSWSTEFGNHDWWCERIGRAVCRNGKVALIPTIVQSAADF